MEISFISRLYLTVLQPVRIVLKDDLSNWLLRELNPPSASGINANGDSCDKGKDMSHDGTGRNGEPATGSDVTIIEDTTKCTPTEASKPFESKCPVELCCHFRHSPTLKW